MSISKLTSVRLAPHCSRQGRLRRFPKADIQVNALVVVPERQLIRRANETPSHVLPPRALASRPVCSVITLDRTVGDSSKRPKARRLTVVASARTSAVCGVFGKEEASPLARGEFARNGTAGEFDKLLGCLEDANDVDSLFAGNNRDMGAVGAESGTCKASSNGCIVLAAKDGNLAPRLHRP